MNLRLFVFLVVLVLTLSFAVFALFLVTGTFAAGLSTSERMVENILTSVSAGIARDYGQYTLQAIDFSGKLSGNIEKKTAQLGISIPELKNHPSKLEEIIDDEFDQSLLSLLIAKSSGIFFILNATVNPALEGAGSSRAGLYLKNMEPGIVSASPGITILRGSPATGRSKSMPLHAQWKMEFDVSDAPYYQLPQEVAWRNPALPLSRLCYWSPPLRLDDSSETVMLCSVPLIDSKGNVFGVCGLEIGEMQFKLSYMPDNSVYKRIFCLLSPVKGQTMDPRRSMFAGGYSANRSADARGVLVISDQRSYFYLYKKPDRQESFLGLHRLLQLYPGDSAFSEEQWAVAVMVPEGDIVGPVIRLNLILFFS